MGKPLQYEAWISGVMVRAASVALTATLLLSTTSAWAQTFTVLYTFNGSPDGANPRAGLILDSRGTLYGTTVGGGVTTCQFTGCGVAFKLDATGKETVLHRFRQGSLGGGTKPLGRLVRDAMGNLYGSASAGGYDDCADGCGSVFKLDKTGKETVLLSFRSEGAGQGPQGLIRDSTGNLYGNAGAGGLCKTCGLVFKLSSTNNYSVLHKFKGASDGANPIGALVRDPEGRLYGATVGGGTSGCGGSGCGTVFKVNQKQKHTMLYKFAGGTDGAFPFAGVVRDSAGNLYGTTEAGGVPGCSGFGCGTVFKLDPTGKETVLYTFTGGTDGGLPLAGVVRDAAGNLYGTNLHWRRCDPMCGRLWSSVQAGRQWH